MRSKRPRDADSALTFTDEKSGGPAARPDGHPDNDDEETQRELLEKEEQLGSNQEGPLENKPDRPSSDEDRGLFSALVGDGKDV